MTDLSKLTEIERGTYLAHLDFLKLKKVCNLTSKIKDLDEIIDHQSKKLDANEKKYQELINNPEKKGDEQYLHSVVILLGPRMIDSRDALIQAKEEKSKLEGKLYFYEGYK